MEVSSFLDGRIIQVCIDDLRKRFEYVIFERDVREQLIHSSDNSGSVNRNSELTSLLPSIPQASAFNKKLSDSNAQRIGAFTALLKRNDEWACKHKFEVRLGGGMRGLKFFYVKTLIDDTVIMQRTTYKHQFVAIREITDVPYVVSVTFEPTRPKETKGIKVWCHSIAGEMVSVFNAHNECALTAYYVKGVVRGRLMRDERHGCRHRRINIIVDGVTVDGMTVIKPNLSKMRPRCYVKGKTSKSLLWMNNRLKTSKGRS